MPEYTVATVVAVVAVVALELFWARTGIFRSAQYWVAMAIVFGFQMLVDGWLAGMWRPGDGPDVDVELFSEPTRVQRAELDSEIERLREFRASR